MHDFAGQTVTLTAHVNDYYNNLVNTGKVNFNVNGVDAGNAPVVNGVATLTWTVPSGWNVGSYIITADFNGTGTNYLNSTNTGTLTVDQTPTTVTVTPTHNFAGQTVILAANVKDYYNQPLNGGKVNFIVNGVDAGTATVSGGVATLTWTVPSGWNVGPYSVTANFNGTSTNYVNSTNSGTLTVDQTPTNVTVTSVHNFAGQIVNLIAYITDYYNQKVNNGQVQFKVDNASPVTVNVVNGVAEFDNWQIPFNWNANTYQITAEFLETTEYLTSSNSSNLNVDQTPTSVTVTPAHNFAGQTVDLKANVEDYYNNPVSAGRVIFIVNGVNAGTADINGGSATLTWTIPSNWNVGPYIITAIFDGTGTNYVNSTNTNTLTIDKTPTNINVTPMNNFAGQDVNLTATVKDYYGNLVNGGIITFTIDHAGTTVNVGTANVNGGVATLNWQIPGDWSIGTYTINASFDGTETNYDNSTDSGILTVDPMHTHLIVDNATENKGKTTNLKATLTDYYGNPVSGKTITFKVNNVSVPGSATTDANGVATLPYTVDLVGGSYVITAEFAADVDYASSTGNGTLKVPQSNVYIQVTPSKTNPTVGENIVITVKVGNNGPDAAQGVVVSYTVPKGFEFVKVTADAGLNPVYDAATRTITWNLGDVPVGDPYMYITLKALSAGKFNNNAEIINETTYDPNTGNKASSTTVNVQQPSVPNANAASRTTTRITGKTIGMQKTGLPMNYLILAILMVIGGLMPRRRK